MEIKDKYLEYDPFLLNKKFLRKQLNTYGRLIYLFTQNVLKDELTLIYYLYTYSTFSRR